MGVIGVTFFARVFGLCGRMQGGQKVRGARGTKQRTCGADAPGIY